MVTVGAPETVIEVRVAAATVSPVLPLIVPDVAVTVIADGLMDSAVSKPLVEMVATAVFDDIQVAVAVRFWVELSL